MLNTSLCHIRGDTFSKSISIEDKDAVPINITGSTFLFSIKKEIDDITPLIQVSGVIIAPLLGSTQITIPSVQMNIDEGSYWYDYQWTDSGGKITTLMRGTLAISYQIT